MQWGICPLHGLEPEGKERQSNICDLLLVSLTFLFNKAEDRGNIKCKHSDNGVHEQGQESQRRLSEEETSDFPVNELPASTRTQNAVTLFVAFLVHLSDNQFKGFRLGNLDPFW